MLLLLSNRLYLLDFRDTGKHRKLDGDNKNKLQMKSPHNSDVKNEVLIIIFITPYQNAYRGGRLSAEGSQGVTVGWMVVGLGPVGGWCCPASLAQVYTV